MLFLGLLTLVLGDSVHFNTMLADVDITLVMGEQGGVPQTFSKDAYGRLGWAANPNKDWLILTIDGTPYELRTSRGGVGYYGCNYNFEVYGKGEYYQNSGMDHGCTKIFEKAPGAIELINDLGKDVYAAFDNGYGFSSDSVYGWLSEGNIAVYTDENPYLGAIGVGKGTKIKVGYYNPSTVSYVSCGEDVTVGDAVTYMLSECAALEAETAVGYAAHMGHCKIPEMLDKNCWTQMQIDGDSSMDICFCPGAEEEVSAIFGDGSTPTRGCGKCERREGGICRKIFNCRAEEEETVETAVGLCHRATEDDIKNGCGKGWELALYGQAGTARDYCCQTNAEMAVGSGSGAVTVKFSDRVPTGKLYKLQMSNMVQNMNMQTTSAESAFKKIADMSPGMSLKVGMAVRNVQKNSPDYGLYISNGAVVFTNEGGSIYISYAEDIPNNVQINDFGDGRFEVELTSERPDVGTGAETKVGGIAGGLTHPHETMTAQYKDIFRDGGKCNGDGQYTWTGKWSSQSCDLACLKRHCTSLGRKTSYGDYTLRQGKIFACCAPKAEESVSRSLPPRVREEAVGAGVNGLCRLEGVEEGICDRNKHTEEEGTCDTCKRGSRWVGVSFLNLGNHWCCTEKDVRENDDCECYQKGYYNWHYADVEAQVGEPEMTRMSDKYPTGRMRDRYSNRGRGHAEEEVSAIFGDGSTPTRGCGKCERREGGICRKIFNCRADEEVAISKMYAKMPARDRSHYTSANRRPAYSAPTNKRIAYRKAAFEAAVGRWE